MISSDQTTNHRPKGTRATPANFVSVDEKSLRNDIENLMRKTVEETPDALLD